MSTKEEIQKTIREWEVELQNRIRGLNEYRASPCGQAWATDPNDPMLKSREEGIMIAQQRISEFYEELKTAR